MSVSTPETKLQTCSFVEMIAACGFGPFVESRLSQDEGLARTNIFFFCIYTPLSVKSSSLEFQWAELRQISSRP